MGGGGDGDGALVMTVFKSAHYGGQSYSHMEL